MTQLSGKNYDASCVIEPNTYYTTIGDSVDIDYVWVRPALGLVAHRAWVVQPNENKYSIEGGSLVTYHVDSSSWVYGEPSDRKLRATNTFVLSQRGDYIFSLEVKYTDGSTSIDKRIVSVLYKEPQGEFNLTTLGITNARGIDFDSEYCQFFAYAKTKNRALEFVKEIEDYFVKVKEMLTAK
jgi:hypothetical protein